MADREEQGGDQAPSTLRFLNFNYIYANLPLCELTG
jgi:hypothetical protein